MVGRYNKLKNILGLTLIEAMVSVVIVGIGFQVNELRPIF